MNKFNISRIISILSIICGLLLLLLSYTAMEFNVVSGLLLLIFVIASPIGLICCLWALLTDARSVKSRQGWLLFFTLTNTICISMVICFLLAFDLNPVGM